WDEDGTTKQIARNTIKTIALIQPGTNVFVMLPGSKYYETAVVLSLPLAGEDDAKLLVQLSSSESDIGCGDTYVAWGDIYVCADSIDQDDSDLNKTANEHLIALPSRREEAVIAGDTSLPTTSSLEVEPSLWAERRMRGDFKGDQTLQDLAGALEPSLSAERHLRGDFKVEIVSRA
ncbi:hypothetical protein HK102_012986, partial [Quaeritorhiza haematococci]